MKPYTHRLDRVPASGPGLLRAITGLLIWSISFLTLYVAHAQGCQLMSPGMSGLLKTGLIILWVLPLIVLGAMLMASWRRMRRTRPPPGTGEPSTSVFMAVLTLLLDLSSWFAVLATGVPILFVPVCAGPA
ncbi:hypothetical protein H0A65_07680 [Alcaligenaceae bacterium]|nr:hypothetical protein [Alcaligenaceae bacterium]